MKKTWWDLAFSLVPAMTFKNASQTSLLYALQSHRDRDRGHRDFVTYHALHREMGVHAKVFGFWHFYLSMLLQRSNGF
jgi:hypothetical protein